MFFGFLLLPAVAALADSGEADNKRALEEVVVTAVKHETRLMETPLSVTAVNQKTLMRHGIDELRDMTGTMPNIQFGLSTADSGVQASIRGVTSTNFTEIGDPAVGIHIDGLYSPRPQGSLALMFDLERIEALRGPQGTLFGRNSTGGTINIIPAKPDLSDSYGDVVLTAGNYDHRQIRSVLNWAAGDTFAMRATFLIDQRDGFVEQERDLTDRHIPSQGFIADGKPDVDQRYNEHVGPEDYYYNSDQWGARLSARWRPSDSVDWNLSYERYQDDGAGGINLKDCEQAEGTPFECERDHWYVKTNVPGKMDMSIDTFRSILSWAISEATVFEYRLAYAVQERFQQHDDDSGYHPLDSQVSANLNTIQPWGDWGIWHVDDRATWTLDSEYQSTVHEWQLKQYRDTLRYVAGVFWLHEDNQIDFAQDQLVNPPFGYPIGQYYRQTDRQVDAKALFAQFDIDVARDWTVTVGGRQSWDEKTDRNGQVYGNWDATTPWYYNNEHTPAPLGQVPHNGTDLNRNMGPFAGPEAYPGSPVNNSHSEDWEEFTWRLGAQYDIDRGQMLFTSVSTGYKAGGFGDKFDICGGSDCVDGPGPQYSFLEYDPETVTNYEFGYKGTLLDQSLNFSATFFYSEYENMQVTGMHGVGKKVLEDGRTCPEWDPYCDVVQAWKTENVAESETMGLEIEYDYIPWDNGRFSGFFAWLDSEIVDYPSYSDEHFCGYRDDYGHEPCPPQSDSENRTLRGRNILNINGNRLPYTPEYSLAVNYEHNVHLGDDYMFVPWLSVRWQDRMYLTVRNFDSDHISDAQEAYTNVDAAFKFQPVDERWFVEAYGTNLTDNIVKNFFAADDGFVSGSYNPPRQYGLRVGARF